MSGRGPGGEVAVQSALFTGADCERIIRFAFDFKRVAADYPDVGTESVLAGAMSAEFVPHPEDLSVVVVSDLNPGRRFPSMFEPVHGSAPDIAGQGLANPVETVAGAGILTRDVGGNASTEDVTRPSSTR